jgi:amino acid transporter, AAT family
MLQVFQPDSAFVSLLAVSGFTGAIAWISICWSQLRFRRRLEASGQNADQLAFKVPFFPYLTHIAIWVQVACLVTMAFSEKLREPLFIGMPMVAIPMLWYALRSKRWARQA